MERNLIKSLFEKLTEIIESANESVWSFAAVILPYIAPITTTALTTVSLSKRLQLDFRISVLFASVLELVGVLVTSFFVHALLGYIKSRNPKVIGMLWFLGGINLAYILSLLSINALLSYLNGENWGNTLIISILCLIPLMSSALYGYYKLIVENKYEKIGEKELAEKIRQEKREDRLKTKALKNGINIFENPSPASTNATAVLAVDTPQVKIKHASDYKDKVWELLEEQWNTNKIVLSPKEITERINKKYRANLVHSKSKGFWTRTTAEWKRSRGL